MDKTGRKPPRELTYDEYLALFGPLLRRRPGEKPDAYKDGQDVARTIVTRSDLGGDLPRSRSEEQSEERSGE